MVRASGMGGIRVFAAQGRWFFSSLSLTPCHEVVRKAGLSRIDRANIVEAYGFTRMMASVCIHVTAK